MAVVKNLLVRCGADFSALATGTQKAQKSLKSMQKTASTSMSSVSNAFAGLKAGLAAAGITLSAAALIGFGKSAIKAASDLQEIQNVVDVTFGPNNKTIENFAKSAIKNFGLSELAAKKYTSNIGAMGKSMGFTSAQNEQMSTTLTGLIGDFASFRNVSTDEAYTAMSAIYTGETESLKRYGILITETNLQEYARTQGITKSITAMTQQEKTMLRYNYILNVTKDAQGDFTRTSGSWANQTRILSQRWQQFLSLMGTGLIQMLTPALKFLNQLMDSLISFADSFSKVTAELFGKQTAVASNTADSATAAASAENSLADATNAASKAAKNSLASFDKLNVLQKGASTGTGVTTTGKTTTVTSTKTDSSGTTSKALDTLKEKLSVLEEPLNSLKTSLGNLKQSLKELWETPAMQKLTKMILDFSIQYGVQLLDAKIKILTGALDQASGEIKIITGLLTGNWKTATDGAKEYTRGFGEIVEGVFVGIIGQKSVDSLKTAISSWGTNISNWYNNDVKKWFTAEQWQNLWTDAKTGCANGWNTVVSWWNTSAVGSWWNTNVKPWFSITQWQTLWTDVKMGWNNGWWEVKNWWNTSAIGSWWNSNVTPWFSVKQWTGIWNGVKSGCSAGWGTVKSWWSGDVSTWWDKDVKKWFTKEQWSGIMDGIKGAINDTIKVTAKAVQAFIDMANKLSYTFPKDTPLVGGKTIGIHFPSIDMAHLPQCATGGIVSSDTLARIGEAGKEAVLPLEQNTEWMDTLAAKIGNQQITFTGANDIMQLVRILQPAITRNNQRVGTNFVNEGGIL